MEINPQVQLLNQYFNLCRNLGMSFPWNYEDLIRFPEKINGWEVKKRIGEILKSSVAKGVPLARRKKNKKRKAAKGKRITGRRPIHLTAIVTERPIEKKHFSKRSKKKQGKKKKKDKFRQPWRREIPSGITQ